MISARAEVEKVIGQFAARAISLQELRRHFTPLLTEGLVGPGGSDQLATDLVHLFEDDSLSSDEHQVNAQRVGWVLSEDFTDSQRRDLLRLIIVQDRLCEIAKKAETGQISRTGFVAFVGKSRLPGRIKQLLLKASPEELRRMCEDVDAVRVDAIRQMVKE